MPFRIRIFLITIGLIVALVLIGPLLVPVTPLEGTNPRHDEALPASQFRTVSGVELHVLANEGDETPDGSLDFLLLHGYPANALSWRKVMPELGLYGTALAFDRPGFGLSERPQPEEWSGGSNPYSLEAQVEQSLALLDDYSIDSALWLGSSSGALTALQAALEHPDRVEGLVLIGAPVYAENNPPALMRLILGSPQMTRVGPLLMRQLGMDPGLDLYRSQWANPDAVAQDDLDAYRLTFLVDDWDQGLWQVTRASRDSGIEGRLFDVDVPVLVVSGDADEIVPSEDAQRLAGELPNATWALMEGCGHVAHEECAAQFTQVVLDWWSDQVQ